MGISWLQDKEAAKHPTIHRTPCATKNHSAPNGNSAEIEKTFSGQS